MINFIAGNALHIPLADKSVQCCISSPPYWGLRDYGTAEWIGGDPECEHRVGRFEYSVNEKQRSNNGSAGHQAHDICPKCGAIRKDAQLGLERTPEEYTANMVAVFREVKRVLRDDGVVWLNLGDSYASSWASGRRNIIGNGSRDNRIDRMTDGLKEKDLVGIPWRVAFALQADGWYLRSDIIWSKPNPMPESVTDRPTKAHEYVFLLTKSQRYYYDADAVREPHMMTSATAKQDAAGLTARSRGEDKTSRTRPGNTSPQNPYHEGGRNRRTVWNIATQPYKGAHFATMPEKLVEPCVLAGTSEKGACPKCGAPWRRVVDHTNMVIDRSERTHDKGQTRSSGTMVSPSTSTTIGWLPSCFCGTEHPIPQEELDADPSLLDDFEIEPFPPVPCLVLDPFSGSGTVAVVSIRHRRSFVGIELNESYIDLAKQRTRNVQPLMV